MEGLVFQQFLRRVTLDLHQRQKKKIKIVVFSPGTGQRELDHRKENLLFTLFCNIANCHISLFFFILWVESMMRKCRFRWYSFVVWRKWNSRFIPEMCFQFSIFNSQLWLCLHLWNNGKFVLLWGNLLIVQNVAIGVD